MLDATTASGLSHQCGVCYQAETLLFLPDHPRAPLLRKDKPFFFFFRVSPGGSGADLPFRRIAKWENKQEGSKNRSYPQIPLFPTWDLPC